jgi:hypothetical protein
MEDKDQRDGNRAKTLNLWPVTDVGLGSAR